MRRTPDRLLFSTFAFTGSGRPPTPTSASPPAGPDAQATAGPPGRTTNDFYDGAETVALPGTTTIEVEGEVANPGRIDLTAFPLRSVIVKETILKDGCNAFVGAYRYDGYALDEVLSPRLRER